MRPTILLSLCVVLCGLASVAQARESQDINTFYSSIAAGQPVTALMGEAVAGVDIKGFYDRVELASATTGSQSELTAGAAAGEFVPETATRAAAGMDLKRFYEGLNSSR